MSDQSRPGAKTDLRAKMREKRRRLTLAQQKKAAKGLVKQFASFTAVQFRNRWSLYLPHKGEIDTYLLNHELQRRKRSVFLPVLHPVLRNRLLFLKYDKSTTLVRNKYGIYEPSLKHTKPVPVWTLNVICLPLVAFDAEGNRLGMGGGYYDRTLAGDRLAVRNPLLVGTAHHFQKVVKIPTASWDIPLHAFVTEKSTFLCKKKS